MHERHGGFVEEFAEVLAGSGWPRMSARIFATLMSTPAGVLTASELSEQLEVGASAVSNGAKMLRTLALVRVTRARDRQISYEVRPDAWMAAVASQGEHLRTLEDILTTGARKLPNPDPAQRLLETADFFAFLRAELPTLVDRWRTARKQMMSSN